MRVMLVDDHPLFAEGLQYLLETYGIEVIGVASCASRAIEMNRTLCPEVILMDIRMPGLNGIDALRLIKAEMPGVKIVMLTASDAEDDLFDAVKYGASGYFLKSTNARELVGMLADLERNEMSLSPSLAGRLLQEMGQRRASSEVQAITPASEEALTERQLQILDMVSRGLTYREAGDSLGLTERTLKYHMGRIIELLHLENRAQVIAYAARMGIVGVTENERNEA